MMKYFSLLFRYQYFSRISGIRHVSLGGRIRVSRKNEILIKGRCYFGPGCYLGSNLLVKGNLLVGPGVYFVGGDHRIPAKEEGLSYFDSGRAELRQTIIEENVWIGANSTIMAGITISEGTIIAAGSTITKSTEPYTIYGSSKQFVIKTVK